jgi:hypothetical protein
MHLKLTPLMQFALHRDSPMVRCNHSMYVAKPQAQALLGSTAIAPEKSFPDPALL